MKGKIKEKGIVRGNGGKEGGSMREVGKEGGKEYSFMYKFYEENK